ncbi:peptidoglycan editing factor PgeF [Alphaproteobacteria bacterium]|nr:peptidoglycan editing factor PgeF [Alphaproteobacteria bacterium]MDC1023261.1 peptidoglycan editing factor PgeF [Alphaproteobacteria bacterium]
MTTFKIQHPILDDLRITYGFFTRCGGISEKPFDSLNCSFNNEDFSSNVKKNLELVRRELNLDTIIQLNQVHSSRVITLKNKNESYKVTKADGLVTNFKGIGLSILGADCSPILFYDNVSQIIGACHAGWRGAVNNIVETTIANMENLGSERNNITAIIGPTIHKNSYEIKEDVAVIVRDSLFYKKNSSILLKKKKGEYLFDLPLLLKESLKLSKIKKIGDVDRDTYTNSNLFFSHRRSTHDSKSQKVRTGRQISIIGILN